VNDISWKTSKRYPTAGVAASQAMRCKTVAARKALGLPVELLGFFGDLYLDPILFCNTSICQPWLTTPSDDWVEIGCEALR
jgi:hypothetical protein